MAAFDHGGVMGEWQADLARTYTGFFGPAPESFAPPPRVVVIGGRRVEVPDQAAIVRVMARLMADRQAVADACTEDDLRAAGFTRGEIRDIGEQARTLARRHVGDRDLADERPARKRERRR